MNFQQLQPFITERDLALPLLDTFDDVPLNPENAVRHFLQRNTEPEFKKYEYGIILANTEQDVRSTVLEDLDRLNFTIPKLLVSMQTLLDKKDRFMVIGRYAPDIVIPDDADFAFANEITGIRMFMGIGGDYVIYNEYMYFSLGDWIGRMVFKAICEGQ